MYHKHDRQPDDTNGVPHPLKSLTPAQFAALGGSAVAFVRPITGARLADMIEEAEFEDDGAYHLVMSADGTPLYVTDSPETVAEWLSDKELGLVLLH